MDGHVEVAKLLLDSGAQVNMPADSFESPLTLAACGGHVELAMLLLERGANIEEVCLFTFLMSCLFTFWFFDFTKFFVLKFNFIYGTHEF